MHALCGERFIGMRIPAWHSLGIIKGDHEQITASQAFKEANLDFLYHKLPIGATLPDGTFIPTSEDVAVYREPLHDDPHWRNLGIVSAGYTFLQNAELAAGIDAISEKTGWPFETAGALGQGETVFVCLKATKHSIKGDEVDSFFLISDGKAANRALRIVVTPVRAVCRNTLMASDSSNSLSITIPHAVGVDQEYKFWLNMISSLERSQEVAFAELHQMAETKITDATARSIFEDAFPPPVPNQRVKLAMELPTMKGITAEIKEEANGALARAVEAYEYNRAQSVKWISASQELYERFNTGNEQGGQMSKVALENLQGTAYAALQAVTELCDWGGTNRDSVASATLFGARATQKTRAWASALRASSVS